MPQRIDPERKRVAVFGKVDPETKRFLESLGQKNHGRAIDAVASLARQQMSTLEDPPANQAT